MAFPPTDWLNWTTAEYDVGAPATSLSFERWFRNPVALAQGAPGAPRVMPLAIDNFLGRITLDTSTTPEAITGIDPETVISAVGNFANGTGDHGRIEVSVSTDGGSSWGGWVSLSEGYESTSYPVHIVVNMKNGVSDSPFLATFDFGAGPFNAIRFRHSLGLYGSGRRVGSFVLYAIGRAP